MALNLSKDFTFSPNTVISSSEVNTNFDELYNVFIGFEAGTSSLSKLPLDADPTSALYAATKQYVDTYAAWNLPLLQWVSANTVKVADNTDTTNKTKIVFHDGNYRSVTEDTAVSTKYRLFDITATAQFTTGTEDSGLRSGLTEANNTWYAIYAVKSVINTANFVLVGDTTFPTLGDIGTINGRYGNNGWVYLGAIRNGDNSGTIGDILDFRQRGNMTLFRNAVTGNSRPGTGIRLATTGGATTLVYTTSFGTGAAQIPLNYHAYFMGTIAAETACSFQMLNSATTRYYGTVDSVNSRGVFTVWTPAEDGVYLSGAGGSTVKDIYLQGFVDIALGIGSNPYY